jgi:hypothetical protein
VATAAPAAPTATVASVTADINNFATQITKQGYVSYAKTASVINYVATHGNDHAPFNCLADFPVTNGSTPTCVVGSPTSKINVVLFGDSHAWQWAGALNVIALARGWKVSVFAKSGCKPEAVTPYQYVNGLLTAYPACATWRTAAVAAIAKLKPSYVVFSEFTAGTTPSLTDALPALATTLIADVGGNAKHVVWIRSTPMSAISGTTSIPACLSSNGYRATLNATANNRCFMTYGDAVQAQYKGDLLTASLLTAAQATGITIIDPMPWLCQTSSNAGFCPPAILGYGPYFDQFHITNSYATFLAPLVNALIPAK